MNAVLCKAQVALIWVAEAMIFSPGDMIQLGVLGFDIGVWKNQCAKLEKQLP